MKKSFIRGLLLVVSVLFLFGQKTYAATYYSAGNNAPNATASWWTGTNGTGTHPANFNTSTDIFIVQNGHTMTTNANWTVYGTVQVNDGGTLTLSGYTIIMYGALNIGNGTSGTFNISSATGTKTFVGLVTINLGGNWNNTANEAVTFRGGINCYGGGNAGTGVQTFDTNSQSINGTLTIANVTVTGVTLTNYGQFNVTTALSGTGALTQGNNSVLYIGGTSAITTLNATNTGNTVIYNSIGNQTAHVNSYYNLTLSTGGTKTITGISTINGTLTIDNAAATPSTGLVIGGDIILNNNFAFTTGAFTHTVSGNWTQNGWGTVTPTGSTINFTGTNAAINGTNADATKMVFNNIIVSKNTNSTLGLGGSFSYITINGDLTLTNGTLSNNGTQIKLAGNWTNNGGIFTGGSGYVTMTGSGKTIGGSLPTSFYNLEIGNGSSNYTTLLGQSQYVNGTLKLSNGVLRLGINNLTLGSSSSVSGTLNSTNMVITDGTGEFRKIFSDNGSFTFPVGDITPNYSPATINLTSGLYTAGAYISLRVTDAIEPNNPSTNNYITRYWTVGQNGITFPKYDFTGSSIYSADNVGTRTSSLTAIDNGGSWTTFGVPAGDTFTISNLSTFGNVTTVNNSPIISTSVSSLTGFGYSEGSGPSPVQSFIINGAAISTNVALTAPTHYEISTLAGSGFTNSITIPAVSTNIPTDTIYVRLKAGFTAGNYNENITAASGSVSKSVAASGTVYPQACPYAGNTNSTIIYTPTVNMTSNVNTVSSSFSTNTYFVLNVIKGLTYQVYTCNTPASALKMSIYEEGNPSNFIASSISNTGNTCNTNANNVYLSFTSPISGQVRILLNAQSSCTATAITGLTLNVNVSGGSNTFDNQNAAGNDTWIGHMYDGTAVFSNYIGYYNTTAYSSKTDEFQEQFGTGGTFPNADNNDVATFNVNSNGTVRAKILDVTYTTRYRMNSTKRGLYTFDVTADDGVRLYVDGTLQYSHWNDQSPTTNTSMLMSLTGSSSLILDYYENGGQNVIGFYNITKIMSNQLTTNASQTICLGNIAGALAISGDVIPATLPTAISSGGYTWSYSTSPSGARTIIPGATSATFTPTANAPFNVPGTYYIYRNVTLNSTYSSTGTPVQNGNPFNANETNESNAAVVVIKACYNYWVGSIDNDWSKGSNWKTGYVPATGDDVEFSTVANNGTVAINDLQLDADRTIGSLINLTNKKLIIPAAKSLIISGTATTLGNNADLIQIKASTSQPNGSLIFTQPLLNTAVNATVEMYAKGSKGSPIIWVGQDGKQYTTSYRWQYIGVPVQSMTAVPTLYGSWLRKYYETKNLTSYYNKWIQQGNDSVLTPFTGYELTQDNPKTISFQGGLVVGNKVLNLTVTSNSSFYGSGYNIFGNSYTAAIDISKIQFPASGVDKTVYLYNTGSLSDWGAGNTYTSIPYNTTSIIGNEIPSMQGFLLIATTNNSTVTIPYNATTNSLTKNTQLQRVKGAQKISSEAVGNANQENTSLSYLKINVKSSDSDDNAWIFDENFTSHAYDNGWDGYKLTGVQGLYICSSEDVGDLQVNTLNNIDNVYVSLRAGNEIQHSLTIKSVNILSKYNDLYLYDLKTGTKLKLDKDSVTYTFNADNTTSAEKRFLISGNKIDSGKVNPFRVNYVNGEIVIENAGYTNGTFYLYDMIGRIIVSKTCPPSSIVTVANTFQQGIYIANTVTDNNDSFSKKIVLK